MDRSPKSRIAPVLPFIAAGIAFTVICVVQSMRQGQLAAPATFDDIVYFVDAGRRLQAFYNEGFPALIKGYVADAPHAPTSTLTTFIGFLLFGLEDWAQALVNGLWVVAVLLVVRRWFAGMPAYVVASVVIAVLAWPVMGFLVIEGRPDIVNGFMLAFGCIALVEQPWVTASRGRLGAIALLFAAALLTKPSVFPITIALYLFSLMVATGLDYIDEGRALGVRRIAQRNAAAIGLTLLVVLPHYALAVGREIRYILLTTFTTEKELWAVKISPYEHATFYLWGDGGHRTMAAWFFITLVLIAIVIAATVIRRQHAQLRRIAGMALVFAVSYGFVSIPAHKSVFLGVQVTSFCFVFFLLACRALFGVILASRQPRRLLAIPLAALLVIAAVATFQWHWFHRSDQPAVGPPDLLAKRRDLIEQTYDAVKPQGESQPKVYFPAIAYYLNPDILNFSFVRHGGSGDEATDTHRSGDVAEHVDAIRNATHVVLFSPDDPDVLAWLPSYHSLAAIRAAVEADPAFTRVASINPPVSGGPIEIYARSTALETLRPAAGLQPLEGPYPQWNLPRIRWATGETVSFAIIDPSPGPAKLHLVVQAPIAGQSVKALIGDRQLGICDVPEAFVTTTCDLPVRIEAGDRAVTLRFAKIGPQSDANRSLIFLNQSLLR